MYITICDACGKQFSRYDERKIVTYDICKQNCHSHEVAEDGNPKGYWSRHLDFCPDCYAKIERAINDVFEDLPDKYETILTIYREE